MAFYSVSRKMGCLTSKSNKNLENNLFYGNFMVNHRTIDEILSDLNPDERDNLENLRALVKSTVPEVKELVKNGKIVYKLGDKDFVWISPFQGHVDLEFAMGASLSSKLLKSRGVGNINENIRHVEISDFQRVKSELTRLIARASTLGFGHCSK
jgi:hypothetical protein